MVTVHKECSLPLSQSKLRQKLSHLHLVTHVKADNPNERSEVTDSEETSLLLGDEAETGRSASKRLKGKPELTVIKSLVPTGSAQVREPAHAEAVLIWTARWHWWVNVNVLD